ncbi:integrase [Amycolatopsis keratiniphila]|uniref:integrase n=1 Tax=Amycolatopsis keratiniphila TaxID=129921 RepID=UPI00190F328D|nr:integrase [Amycolatopsis keratiniphila]
MIQTASKLRSLLAWSKTAGLPLDPSHWNAADLRRRVKGLRATQKPGTVVAHVVLIKRLAAVAPALTCDWPSEDPWPGRSARQVAHYAGQRELATKAISPEIWFPLIRAAWAYVHTFAPDILRAVGRRDELLAAVSPSILGRHAEVEAWLANTANKIPVHAAPREDGQPRVNWLLLDLLVGLRSQPTYSLVKSSRHKSRVLRVVAEGRTTTQGLVDGLAQVSRPDGTVGPWHPGIGPQHLFNLTVALRNAAFVLVAGLSMMRDSEIHAITRGNVVEHYNSPAIASIEEKGDPSSPRKHWWIIEPVAEAITVAEAVSPHAERVFAPLARPHVSETVDGAEMTAAFIAFVNAARGWTGLEEIPAGAARPHMFRRTMAMLTDQFPGSEIALGIQLKHAATRALANRVTQGYAASDPSWSKHLESAIDAARFRRIKDLYQAHKNGHPVGFGPGAAQISKAFDEIQESVAARGGDARVEESLLRKARITIRFGTLNHCLFDPNNPVGAVCLEHATIPAGHTGPLEERCRPDRCRNSLIGAEHIPIYDAHRRTQLAVLQTPNLPACRQALIRRELERVEAVLDTIPKEPR